MLWSFVMILVGYLTGDLIISQSSDMKLKGGTPSIGKKIMIDDFNCWYGSIG